MAKPTVAYENNPFYIGLNGMKMFFNLAKSVAIFAVILSAVSFISDMASSVADISTNLQMTKQQQEAQQRADAAAVEAFFSQDPGKLAVIGVIGASALFLFIVAILWIYGSLEYTGAQMAKGKRVTLKEALAASGRELASYVWLWVIIFVKVFLWSLLFIIPGIIMAIRYSLAGTVFFAEDKRGNAAVKRSLELTKGAWFTTFGGMALWNIMTIGAIVYLLQPGINATLYRQYAAVTDAGEQKPAAHWLSWASLIAPIAFIGMLVTIITVLVVVYAIATGA